MVAPFRSGPGGRLAALVTTSLHDEQPGADRNGHAQGAKRPERHGRRGHVRGEGRRPAERSTMGDVDVLVMELHLDRVAHRRLQVGAEGHLVAARWGWRRGRRGDVHGATAAEVRGRDGALVRLSGREEGAVVRGDAVGPAPEGDGDGPGGWTRIVLGAATHRAADLGLVDANGLGRVATRNGEGIAGMERVAGRDGMAAVERVRQGRQGDRVGESRHGREGHCRCGESSADDYLADHELVLSRMWASSSESEEGPTRSQTKRWLSKASASQMRALNPW